MHVFSNSWFFVLNSLTANIQFLKIQLQVFKMKKKFGTCSILKIQSAEIQIVQKVGQRSSTGKSRWSPKSRTKHLLRPGGDMFGSLRLVLSWPQHINSWERDNMSWPRDHFVEIRTSLCRGHTDVKLREQRHPFLVDTSLMRKQTCVTIATCDYQRWIKKKSPSHSLVAKVG